MSGILTDDGSAVLNNLIFKQSEANRGSSLQLGLFTNDSLTAAAALASITEPTGTGYARITLADANWNTATQDTASFAKQTFNVGAGGWTGSVYGYFLATTGTTPKLIAYQFDPNGPYTLAANEKYDVTLNIVLG